MGEISPYEMFVFTNALLEVFGLETSPYEMFVFTNALSELFGLAVSKFPAVFAFHHAVLKQFQTHSEMKPLIILSE